MKISSEEVSRILQIQRATRANGNGNGNGNGKTAAVHGTASATVEVSGRAKEIQRIKKAIDAEPDIREDLVNTLKARIESGEYRVNGEEVADLMIRRALADRIR